MTTTVPPQVANLACSMSSQEEGVKMVRMAAAQIESLCPQVINAARVLAARPKSKVSRSILLKRLLWALLCEILHRCEQPRILTFSCITPTRLSLVQILDLRQKSG